MKLLTTNLSQLKDKTVLVRCNFDVPIENSIVQDTTRIESAFPTLKALLNENARLILIAHYDRPGGKSDPQKSLHPVVEVLERHFPQEIDFIKFYQDFRQLKPSPKPISLIENLRFWPQEKSNDAEFAKHLASLADAYVNEAFANCHRNHASITGIPALLPSFAGLQLEKEINTLTKIRDHPLKPLVVIVGGAKLKTKEPLITAFKDKADHILVGGKVALDLRAHPQKLSDNVTLAQLTRSGRDITEQSAQQFADIILKAKSVIWNGTMGVFEEDYNQKGTRIVAEAINETPAFTLAGGGDTEAALTELNMLSGIDFISTGGGAMLTFLTKGTLPGIDALN